MKLTFSTLQGTIVQTCDRCQPEVPCHSHTKSLEITVLVEAHDKVGHQGTTSYLLSHQVPILLEGYE